MQVHTVSDNFAGIAKMAQYRVESAQKSCDEFAEAFKVDPAHALSWGAKAFDAAARLKVWTWLSAALQTVVDGTANAAILNEETALPIIVKELTRDVLSAGRYPASSTSEASNMMERAIASAKAHALDDLRFF